MITKRVLFFICCLISIGALNAQSKPHHVVFEITSGDTAVQHMVLSQMNNVFNDASDTRLELVCHGPAIQLLLKDRTLLGPMMDDLKSKHGVIFAACANSMRKNHIDASQLVAVAQVVPNGVMEVVAKQESGWSYIKAGD